MIKSTTIQAVWSAIKGDQIVMLFRGAPIIMSATLLSVAMLALLLNRCTGRRNANELEARRIAYTNFSNITNGLNSVAYGDVNRIEVKHHHQTPLDLSVLDYGYNNIFIGVEAGLNATGLHNAILIGDHTSTTNNFEMVIRFKSGKEWRMPLPTNDPVSLQRFIDPSKPKLGP